jgi:hypothetical protein
MLYIILQRLFQADHEIPECYIFFIYRWNALGTCFDKIDKKNEAIKCYEKAESCKDKECI